MTYKISHCDFVVISGILVSILMDESIAYKYIRPKAYSIFMDGYYVRIEVVTFVVKFYDKLSTNIMKA